MRSTRSKKRNNDSAADGETKKKRGRKVGSVLPKKGEKTRESRRLKRCATDGESSISNAQPSSASHRLTRTATCETIGLFVPELQHLRCPACDKWAECAQNKARSEYDKRRYECHQPWRDCWLDGPKSTTGTADRYRKVLSHLDASGNSELDGSSSNDDDIGDVSATSHNIDRQTAARADNESSSSDSSDGGDGRSSSPLHPSSPGPIDGKKLTCDVDYSKAPPFEAVLLAVVKRARAKGESEDTTVRLIELLASQYQKEILPARGANNRKPSEAEAMNMACELDEAALAGIAGEIVTSAVTDVSAASDHRINCSDSVIRGQTILDVPNDHELVYSPHQAKIERLAVVGSAVERATKVTKGKDGGEKVERHNFTGTSRIHYADGLMEAPQLSLYAAEQAIVHQPGSQQDEGRPYSPCQCICYCRENPKKKIRQTVRGEPRTIVQLNNAKERCQNLNRIRGILVKQKKLKDALKTKNENRSDVARATAQANEFRRKHLLERAPNKRQRERGVDRTYLVVGRIPYKVLRATIPEHMDPLQAELVHRGADPANIPAGCRDRIKMLKELENDKKSFRAKTPVNFEL